MRGERKPSTLEKLDRSRVLPFYISEHQKFLYDQDDYKYLIHLYRCFPVDHYGILQYLMLRFYPLLLRKCHKYHKKGINLDWLELISFGRHAFVELIMRFPLNSTLYFRKYIPLALDRAINDYHIYMMRRKALSAAVRVDQLPDLERSQVLTEGTDLASANDGLHEEGFSEVLQEVVSYVSNNGFTPQEQAFFTEAYVEGDTHEAIALKRGIKVEYVSKKLRLVLASIKVHLRQNYL